MSKYNSGVLCPQCDKKGDNYTLNSDGETQWCSNMNCSYVGPETYKNMWPAGKEGQTKKRKR